MIAALGLWLAQVAASPSPDEIFRRAQQAWEARRIPAYESFQIACDKTFLADRCSAGDIVAFTVRMSDGRTYAQTVARDGAAQRVLLRGGYITGPAGAPLGFYRALPRNGSSPLPSPAPNLAPDPLQTIATVTANAHIYEVTLAGEETIGADVCYHLLLRPTVDPPRHPLRELWVDQRRFDVVQLVYAWPYDDTHTQARVTYRFAPIGWDRIWAIVHIEAAAKSDRVSDDLSDITFPATAPEWYFERAE